MMKVTYRSSGVNINNAENFVNAIKPFVKKTYVKGILGGIGNFGGFFEPQIKKFKKPVLVSSIDGVGTKLKIAALVKKYDTIGEDLVNHCVNDIAVCGAMPIFFLDYYATGKLDNKAAVDIVKGLVRGCINNGCAIIGGETAEMPGLYGKDDFDLAGAIVGIVDRHKIINYKKVKKGDLLIGVASNGLHTNGYSLVRKVFNTKEKITKYYEELGCRLDEELLKVHKSYLNIIQGVIKNFRIKSISHITGGGIEGNTKRVILDELKMEIFWDAWERPAIFNFIQKAGKVPEADMRRTFNLGIGLIFVISKNEIDNFISFLRRKKENHFIIGEIV
ncbi:MAG TPA: phosphoribosylformylglycinamidine cyclo-ligase [Ignavibacteria bacterium]